MSNKPHDLSSLRARQTLVSVAGAAEGGHILVVVFLFVTLGWMGDLVLEVLRGLYPGWWPLGIVLFPVVLIAALWQARRAAREFSVEARAIEESRPRCRVLVIFLSPSGRDAWLESAADAAAMCLTEEADRARFEGPWRMAVEAVATHISKLERLVVIPSEDFPGRQDGTFRVQQRFAETIEAMLPKSRIGKLSIETEPAVDFEDVGAVIQSVEAVFERLTMGAAEYDVGDVLVDVTGGQKSTTIAGAAVALGKGRVFQCVSTRGDYKVRRWDITYHS